MWRLACCLSALALMACTVPAAEPEWRTRERKRIEVLKRIAPSVVCVMSGSGEGGGSGVLISADGLAITNYHVTSGSGNFLKCGLNDGNVYDAVIAGIDPTGDVAMIRLLGRSDFPFASPGNSDDVRVGDEVMALGNPFLLADDFTPTVTWGIASGIHRYQYPANTFLEYTDCIQIDASINPGNSGGPLFDIHGRWIGINGRASFEQRGRVNVGAAYAISVNQVLFFLGHLKSGRIVDHGTADFSLETDTTGVVLVRDLANQSEAWRRGLRRGDEVLSFAGRALTSANDFKNVLGIFPAGARVPLTYRNEEGQYSTSVRLRPLHEYRQAPKIPEQRQETPQELQQQKPPEPPEKWKHLFEARDGFTNYAFNRMELQRLSNPLSECLDGYPQRGRTWVIRLTDDITGQTMELIAGRDGAGLTLNGTPWHQDAAEPDPDVEPDEYPGLLTAAIQWHRLIRSGLNDWTDAIYLGTEQHLETGQMVDLVVTQQDTLTCRWMFVADQELPFGVDVDSGLTYDESRLLFANWTVDGPVQYPGKLGLILPATGEIRWLTVNRMELR